MSEVLFWATIAGVVLVASLRFAYLLGVNAGLNAAQNIAHGDYSRLEPGHRRDKTAADCERDKRLTLGTLQSHGVNEDMSPDEFPPEAWWALYSVVSIDRDRWRYTARNGAGNV